MRYGYYEQRIIPYGNLRIEVCTKKGEYLPTNEDVLLLAREIFGLPTRKEYEKLSVRLYWDQNIRMFECTLWGLVTRKNLKRHYDMDAYDIMNAAGNAGIANGWLVSIGNNHIDKIYGISMVKVV